MSWVPSNSADSIKIPRENVVQDRRWSEAFLGTREAHTSSNSTDSNGGHRKGEREAKDGNRPGWDGKKEENKEEKVECQKSGASC